MKLIGIESRRCLKLQGFDKIMECSIHDFSDVSQEGYG